MDSVTDWFRVIRNRIRCCSCDARFRATTKRSSLRRSKHSQLLELPEPERTLTLLAAGTGLRISECLGLQWQDLSFTESCIRVRRTWTCGEVGLPRSKASQAPVPLHPLLAEFMQSWLRQTPYSRPSDWVFPSFKLKGKQPRVANMLEIGRASCRGRGEVRAGEGS